MQYISSILQARPDANAVLHSHTRAGASVSAMGEGLLPLSQHAIEIQDLVCYHPYTYAPDDNSECERLANDIGDKWLMINAQSWSFGTWAFSCRSVLFFICP